MLVMMPFILVTHPSVPANDPKAAEIHKALADSGVYQRLAGQGLDPAPSSSEEVTRLIRSDLDKWSKVVKTPGIKLE